jgi:hypothetical protein
MSLVRELDEAFGTHTLKRSGWLHALGLGSQTGGKLPRYADCSADFAQVRALFDGQREYCYPGSVTSQLKRLFGLTQLLKPYGPRNIPYCFDYQGTALDPAGESGCRLLEALHHRTQLSVAVVQAGERLCQLPALLRHQSSRLVRVINNNR